MPIVRIYGVDVRQRPMLDAIGAQEWLEHVGGKKPPPFHGPSAMQRWERERLQCAGRRNAAEKKLRPNEHAAWDRWRKADANEREAVRAVLTDLPTKEERRAPLHNLRAPEG